jgi:hypothetical protein
MTTLDKSGLSEAASDPLLDDRLQVVQNSDQPQRKRMPANAAQRNLPNVLQIFVDHPVFQTGFAGSLGGIKESRAVHASISNGCTDSPYSLTPGRLGSADRRRCAERVKLPTVARCATTSSLRYVRIKFGPMQSCIIFNQNA